MTPEQFIRQQEKILRVLTEEAKPFGIAVQSTHKQLMDRVFIEGKDPDGEMIGTYSPGYKKKREKRGFETKFVNLRFEGLLQTDFRTGLKKETNTHWVAMPKTVDNQMKAEENEKRFKKLIFVVSEAEEKELLRITEFETQKTINRHDR